MFAAQLSPVETVLDGFVADVLDVTPELIEGGLFLLLAVVAVRLVTAVARALLARGFPDEPIYVEFVTTVIAVFLWFGVGLAFLSIVGLGEIAAALGTASGFVALGVAYALSGMIADAVAGVYLLRDPDFNPGDRVTVDDTTGEVERIELRKTRLAVDGDTLVRGNAAIEEEWTRLGESGSGD